MSYTQYLVGGAVLALSLGVSRLRRIIRPSDLSGYIYDRLFSVKRYTNKRLAYVKVKNTVCGGVRVTEIHINSDVMRFVTELDIKSEQVFRTLSVEAYTLEGVINVTPNPISKLPDMTHFGDLYYINDVNEIIDIDDRKNIVDDILEKEKRDCPKIVSSEDDEEPTVVLSS